METSTGKPLAGLSSRENKDMRRIEEENISPFLDSLKYKTIKVYTERRELCFTAFGQFVQDLQAC